MPDIVEELARYLQHRWKGWTQQENEECYRLWKKVYGQVIADKIREKVEGKK